MNLFDIIHRKTPPEPWTDSGKIPWNDPDFSARMLNEHLSQAHDAASRRFEIIDQQVNWIHQQVLNGKPTRVLDLGCGPGFYTSRLAKLGYSCTGIDFSPASIDYAKQQAAVEDLACSYLHEDIRSADFGSGFGLVMMVFGEINVFKPADAVKILEKAFQALIPGGVLLLEPHTFDAVVSLGKQPGSWYSTHTGLFSDQPHILLQENFWDDTANVAVQRFYVIDALTGTVTSHSSCNQAYTNGDYHKLLTACGFKNIEFFPSLGEYQDGYVDQLMAIRAQKVEE